MSDDQDEEGKTEEATEKRIQEAREKGNIAVSREITHLTSLAFIYLIFATWIPWSYGVLATRLSDTLVYSGLTKIDSIVDIFSYSWNSIIVAVLDIAFVFFLMIVAVLAAASIQGSLSLLPTRVLPTLQKISLQQGLKRLFSYNSITGLLKTIITLVLFFGVSSFFFFEDVRSLGHLIQNEPGQILTSIHSRLLYLIGALTICALITASLDLIWVRLQWRRRLRMTKQEVKDEHKDVEGDPIFKFHRRSRALQQSRNRMMSAVPAASVVITNPTHFAVALRYDSKVDPAPVVVAKGRDKLALRIKANAQAANVSIHEDRLLARSIYNAVDLDQIIPPHFYTAVAEVIIFVQNRRQRRSYNVNTFMQPT